MVASLFEPRSATQGDLPAIEGVVRSAYTPYIDRIGRAPGPMLDDYGALIRSGHVHVLERDGTVQAVLVLIPEPDALLLDNVAVEPSAQGTGLGRAMLDFAERVARQSAYRAIRLYTNAAMTENVGLYTRLGYAETHRGEENGFKRVYMVKRLA